MKRVKLILILILVAIILSTLTTSVMAVEITRSDEGLIVDKQVQTENVKVKNRNITKNIAGNVNTISGEQKIEDIEFIQKV